MTLCRALEVTGQTAALKKWRETQVIPGTEAPEKSAPPGVDQLLEAECGPT